MGKQIDAPQLRYALGTGRRHTSLKAAAADRHVRANYLSLAAAADLTVCRQPPGAATISDCQTFLLFREAIKLSNFGIILRHYGGQRLRSTGTIILV